MTWRAPKVAQDALHGRQMGLPRVMHVEADLLHRIGNLGSSKSQVLKRAGETPELSSILNRRPGVCSKLRLEVDRSSTRLAVSHDRTLDNVKRVGALVEE